MSRLPSPVDPNSYIGTVTQVTASQVHVNLPEATAKPETRGLAKGAVGDFVFIDCERFKLLGRIVETRIPDAERLTVEPKLGEVPIPNPIGRVQMLAALEQGGNQLQRGIPSFPRIGDGVYLANPALLAQLIRNAVARQGETTLRVGRIDAASGVDVCLPPEKVFGRHCGVFGTTGGGKSWTLATLIQELKEVGGKAILFDPTGEFTNIAPVDTVFVFERAGNASHKLVHFPYRRMTEDDLFSLFKPSGQSQGPKLRDAVKSLKLVEATRGVAPAGVIFQNGFVEKANKLRSAFYGAVAANRAQVHSPLCEFDVRRLPAQIRNECVRSWGTAGNFGNPDDSAASYCETLIARINTQINSKELECLFGTNGTSLVVELDAFLADETRDVAIISFRDVRFEHNTRELLLNIIGRYLLGLARADKFRDEPLVVFLDEAHQFLGRIVGDEYGSTQLDAFGLIAKEGRKYGLTCVLATQRPRDIPHDVLSQLGTLFVHRLTNSQDRETVESACGDLDRGAAQFIPMLAPGEAVLIGPDLPAPVPIFVNAPASPPNSRGPAYQKYWRARREAADARAAQSQSVQSRIPTPREAGSDEGLE
jgi:DNA helicase HerA-like ATPase